MSRSTWPLLALLLVQAGTSSAYDHHGLARRAAYEAEHGSGPAAGEALRPRLDEARGLLIAAASGEEVEAALASAERALAAAGDASDPVARARAGTLRAIALEDLERSDAARAAWAEVEEAWRKLGDGPGQVWASCARSYLMASPEEEGDPPPSLALLDSAIALAEGESERPRVAAMELARAGTREYARQNLAAAARLWPAAVAQLERHAPGSPELAGGYNMRGNIAWFRSDLGAAREDYERSLAIHQKLEPLSQAVANSLGNLGLVSWQQGDLDSATEYFQRSLELTKEIGGAPEALASGLNNLGLVAIDRHELSAATEYLQQAITLLQDAKLEVTGLAQAWHNLGRVEEIRNNLEVAQQHFARGLDITQRLAPGSLHVATGLLNLGNVLGDLGDFEGARVHLLRALEIVERQAPDSMRLADVLDQLAWLGGELRDASSRGYTTRALAIRERLVPGSWHHAVALSNVADDEATGHRALALFKELGGGGAAQASLLQNMADWASRDGRLEEAEAFLQQALDEAGSGTVSAGPILRRLAGLASRRGEDDAAADFLTRSLAALERRAPDSMEVARTLGELGRLEWARGRLDLAEEHLRRAWDIRRRASKAVTSDETRLAFAQGVAPLGALLARMQVGRGRVAEAFATLEQTRARALLQLLAERGHGVAGAGSRAWKERQRSERARERAAEALAEAGVAEQRSGQRVAALRADGAAAEAVAAAEAEWKESRSALDRARDDYSLAHASAGEALHRLRASVPALAPESLQLDEARAQLPAGSLLLSFLVGEKSTLAFLVAPELERPVIALEVALGGLELARRTDELRGLLASRSQAVRGVSGARRRAAATAPSAPEELVAASRALFRELFPKEAREAIAKAERLVVSPDGPLWGLPFAGLVTSQEGEPTWLGIEKSLSYTPSLTVLALERRRARAPRSDSSVLVVGDPEFTRAPADTPAETRGNGRAGASPLSTAFLLRGEVASLVGGEEPPSRLPGTRAEALAVASLHGVEPLLGAAATESAVRARLADASIVHLATHGFLHPTRAMSSGLLLGAPPVEPAPGETHDDGALQAWEIASQFQLQAELVVLSACETGRGETVRAEGLVGLTRALQSAGARSIVATQWPVEDRASATLMVAFHERLKAGMAFDRALSEAMQALAGRPETSHPWYWAGFLLAGDADGPPFRGR